MSLDQTEAPARRAPPGPLKRTVALVGLMGAGKSSVGKRLASALGAPFRDADDEIERAAAMSISEIFARFGEPYFREGERRVIARMLSDPPHVLATGGGAFMDPDTRRLLAQRAVTVWLRVDLDTLAQRTARRDHRPLLQGGDPRAVLSALIDARYPVYAQADIVVDSRDEPHGAMVDEILARLDTFGVATAPRAAGSRPPKHGSGGGSGPAAPSVSSAAPPGAAGSAPPRSSAR